MTQKRNEVLFGARGSRSVRGIGDVLREALARRGLDSRLAHYRFVSLWPEIVGEAIANHSVPELVKRGVLVVRVSDSVWAQELTFRRETILRRIKRLAPEAPPLTSIRFVVGPVVAVGKGAHGKTAVA